MRKLIATLRWFVRAILCLSIEAKCEHGLSEYECPDCWERLQW